MPHSLATPRSLARAAIALESGRVVRPRTTADPGQPDAVRAWEAWLDAGLIGPSTPPSVSSSVIASRDAADALFRRIAAGRRRAGGEGPVERRRQCEASVKFGAGREDILSVKQV